MARVVVSLVTWNSAKDLPACLSALALQTFKDLALVIIDNASTDGTQRMLSELPVTRYPLRVTLNNTNRGFAAAHNQGIRWAKEHGAAFVLVLNPDVVLKPNALAVMVNAMERHPNAASVGIPLLHDNGTIDSLGLAIGWGGRLYERGAGMHYTSTGHPDEQVLGVSGACVLYRLAALESVAYDMQMGRAYFDERFFAYKEDCDLALRLKHANWSTWIVHDSSARHTRTIAQHTPRKERSHIRSYLSYRNHLYLLKKHWKYFPANKVTIAVYEIAKALYVLVREPWLLRAWKELRSFLVT